MSISPIGFKGIYKVTLPNVKEATNQQEKGAFTDAAFNTVVLGANNVLDSPRISEDKKIVYFLFLEKQGNFLIFVVPCEFKIKSVYIRIIDFIQIEIY